MASPPQQEQQQQQQEQLMGSGDNRKRIEFIVIYISKTFALILVAVLAVAVAGVVARPRLDQQLEK